MNRNIIIGVALVTTLLIGLLLGRAWSPHPAADAPGDAQREVLYWVAPMDPNFRRDEPGKSPMGMDLVPVYADAAGSAPGVVSIDPTMVNNLGVRTAVAERGTLPRASRRSATSATTRTRCNTCTRVSMAGSKNSRPRRPAIR